MRSSKLMAPPLTRSTRQACCWESKNDSGTGSSILVVSPSARRGGHVTTTSVSREGPVEPAERSSSIQLLTKTERGRRNRRTIDSVALATAALVIGLSAVIASSAREHDEA